MYIFKSHWNTYALCFSCITILERTIRASHISTIYHWICHVSNGWMIQTVFVTQLFARVLTLIGYNVIDNYHSELVCISDAIKTRCYFFLRCCLAYVGLNNVLNSLHFFMFQHAMGHVTMVVHGTLHCVTVTARMVYMVTDFSWLCSCASFWYILSRCICFPLF